jgi:hypothetical protein
VERVGSTLYVMPTASLFERLGDTSEDSLLVPGLADVATSTSAVQ